MHSNSPGGNKQLGVKKEKEGQKFSNFNFKFILPQATDLNLN